MAQTTIGRQTASYREGLVLGLTMAEIMLLLVFCLLVAVGVALVKERNERDEALAHLKAIEATAAADAAMVASISRNPELAELLEQRTGRRRARDRRILAYAGGEQRHRWQARAAGRAAEVLRDKAGSFAQMRQLITRNISPDKLARALALQTAIDMPYRSAAKLPPDEIVALIERGLAAASTTSTERTSTSGHTWPPIINLSEANGYFFATGRAELTPDFEYGLRTSVARRLLQIAASYDVDVIEVIGHTDEQPVTGRASNLDRNLPGVMLGETDPNSLQWGDNAGLGLARALAVVRVLSADPRLQAFRILPLSAAQLIDTDGTLTRWDYQATRASAAASRSACASRRSGTLCDRHALRVLKNIVGIERFLDLLQPGQVGSPIGLCPIGEIEITVVDVAFARHEGAHGGVERADWPSSPCVSTAFVHSEKYWMQNSVPARCAKAVASRATWVMAPP